jgi:hypothetical protein
MISSTGSASTITAFNVDITINNAESLDLRPYLLQHTAWNGYQRLKCTVTITGVIGSTSSTVPAFLVRYFNPDLDLITIINKGTILGCGGVGNGGGSTSTGGNGGNGGDALYTRNRIHLENYGKIYSGGGGGGAGAGYWLYYGYDCSYTTDECGGWTSCYNWKNLPANCQCCCNDKCTTKNAWCYGCKEAACRLSYKQKHPKTCYANNYDTGAYGSQGQGYTTQIGAPAPGTRPSGGGAGGYGGLYGATGNSGANTAATGNYKGGLGGDPGASINGYGFVTYIDRGGGIAGPTIL